MRDPDRIEPMLDAIREAWLSEPDTRLLQLMCNAYSYYVEDATGSFARGDVQQLFNIEDDALLIGIRKMSKPTS